MNTIVLMAALVGQRGPMGCPAPSRPGLFGGSRYSCATPVATYAPPVTYAAPVTYVDAGGCYGGSISASCYSAQYVPQSQCASPSQQAPPTNRPTPGPPAMGSRHTMNAPELVTYGIKHEDGTYTWGVSKEESIAAWKRGERIPTSRVESPPQRAKSPSPRILRPRAGTRFVSTESEPKMPLADVVNPDVRLVSTAAEKVFDLDTPTTPLEGREPRIGRFPTAPGSPARAQYGDTAEAVGPPPKALYCPGCGGERSGNFRQLDSDEDCVVTCMHSGCNYRFSWKNTPDQWHQVMQRCPYCTTELAHEDGEVKCTKCWFKFAVKQYE